MSNLNEETIKTLCQLTRLVLNDEEVAKLSRDMQRIVDYIELLEEVDVSNLSPYSHMDEQGCDALREDEVKPTLSREVFLNNSPDQIGGMIRVPTVLKDV